MKRLLATLLIILLGAATAAAQELEFKSFEFNVHDAAARAKAVVDLSENPCALLRVYVAVESADFKANLGILEDSGKPAPRGKDGSSKGNLGVKGKAQKIRNSEYVMYIPAGSKSITIQGEGFLPFTYHFNQEIKGLCTYELYLKVPESGPKREALESQFLAMSVTPASATVVVDEMMRTLEGGQLFLELPLGRHTYQVMAPMHHIEQGEFEISAQGRTDLKIDLKPAFGTLKVNSTPSDATVMVDGVVKGTTPCSLQIESGNHFVQVMHEGYISYAQNVTVTDGSTLPLTAGLKANFAQVTLRAPHAESEIWLGGEKIGTGTWSGRLNAGTYSVEVRTEGYETAVQNIEVVADTPKSYTLTGAHAIYGVLKVTSSPMGATVKLDGKVLGTTPFLSNEVLTGNRTLALELKGYNPYTKELAIVKGKTTEVSATLSNEPVYKVGDFYRRGNKVGIIFEVDATGRKGKIVSPYEDFGRYKRSNYEEAQKVITAVKGAGWRVPTYTELQKLYNLKSELESKAPHLYTDDYRWSSKKFYYPNGSYGLHRLNLATGKADKENAYQDGRMTAVCDFDIAKDSLDPPAPSKSYRVGDLYEEGEVRGIVYKVSPDGRSGMMINLVGGIARDFRHPKWNKVPTLEQAKELLANREAIQSRLRALGLKEIDLFYYKEGSGYLGYDISSGQLVKTDQGEYYYIAPFAADSQPFTDVKASTPAETIYKTTSAPYKIGDFYNEQGLMGVVFSTNTRGNKVWVMHLKKLVDNSADPITAYTQKVLKDYREIINSTLSKFYPEEVTKLTEENIPNRLITCNFVPDYKIGDYYNENDMEGVVIFADDWGETGLLISLKQAGPMPWCTLKQLPKTNGKRMADVIRSQKGWEEKFPVYYYASQLPEGWTIPSSQKHATLFIEFLNSSEQQARVNETLIAHGGDPVDRKQGYWMLDPSRFITKSENTAALVPRFYIQIQGYYEWNAYEHINYRYLLRPIAAFRSSKSTQKSNSASIF